jgi:hypothetical protein
LALDGHSALVHTAAASNLGQMLVKVCAEDGISAFRLIRASATASSRAVQDTGATVAFDAVGEGTLASELIYAMEQAAASRLIFHSPFGSFERKHVYI